MHNTQFQQMLCKLHKIVPIFLGVAVVEVEAVWKQRQRQKQKQIKPVHNRPNHFGSGSRRSRICMERKPKTSHTLHPHPLPLPPSLQTPLLLPPPFHSLRSRRCPWQGFFFLSKCESVEAQTKTAEPKNPTLTPQPPPLTSPPQT